MPRPHHRTYYTAPLCLNCCFTTTTAHLCYSRHYRPPAAVLLSASPLPHFAPAVVRTHIRTRFATFTTAHTPAHFACAASFPLYSPRGFTPTAPPPPWQTRSTGTPLYRAVQFSLHSLPNTCLLWSHRCKHTTPSPYFEGPPARCPTLPPPLAPMPPPYLGTLPALLPHSGIADVAALPTVAITGCCYTFATHLRATHRCSTSVPRLACRYTGGQLPQRRAHLTGSAAHTRQRLPVDDIAACPTRTYGSTVTAPVTLIYTTIALVDARQLPFHFPNVQRRCTAPSPANALHCNTFPNTFFLQ